MSRLFNGSSDRANATGAPVTAAPLVMSCWFYPSADTDMGMLQINAGDDTNWFSLDAIAAGDTIRFHSRTAAGGSSFATATNSWTLNAWNHACGIEVTDSDRRVYQNGAGLGTNTLTRTPSGVNAVNAGYRERVASDDWFFDGRLAEAAIWNLSSWPGATSANKADAFIAQALPALANGFTPAHFPLGLVAYWPLIGRLSPELDVVGGRHFTMTGTSAAVHATPTRRRKRKSVALLVPVGNITLTAPVRYRTYQRSGGTADISGISGTYTGSPTAIEASFNGGAYATIDASPTGGSFSGTLSTQSQGQGTLTVRFTNATGVTDSVNDIGIGDIFLVAGQSNAEGRATNLQSYAHGSLKGTKYTESDTWAELTDPTDPDTALGSPWPLLATHHMEDQGVPVAFLTAAEGATGLVNPSDWNKEGTATSYNNAVSQVTSSGVNAVLAVLWHQGESDINNSVSRADYNAELDDLISDLRAEGGALATAVLVCAQVGYKTTGSPTDADLNAVRLGQSDAWDDNANIHEGPTLYDIGPLADGVHFATDAEVGTLADRWWVAIDKALFDGTRTAPKLVSAVASADNLSIIVTFDQSLTSGTLTANAFGLGGDGTPPTVSSATAAGSVVVLELSGELTANPTVSLGNGNDSNNKTVPQSTNVTLPDTSTIKLSARPFISQSVTTATGGGGMRLVGAGGLV